jgi:two-component system, LytTR family, sensor kinase
MKRGLDLKLYVAAALVGGAYLGLNQLIGLRSDGSTLAGWKPFVWELSSTIIVVALVPLVVRLERRFPVDAKPRGPIVAVHLAAALAFSAAHTVFIVTTRKLIYAFAGETYDFNLSIGPLYELQKDIIVYCVILIVLFAAREFRVRRAGELRAAELAAELGEARLRQLTAQIEPHFLFNSLNAISNRMHEDVHAADRMISQLGDLLRAAYDADDSVLVPLRRELGWLDGYTAMMTERFRDRLEYSLDVEADLDDLRVPRLLLQPLVENALRHGLGDGCGRLAVAVRRRGARLEYTVSDDGAGLSTAESVSGTGLANVRRRLELLFPNDHELTVAARAPRGVTVTLAFPVPA